MSNILDIVNKEGICEINIDEEALSCLESADIEKQLGDGRRVVKFYVDRTLKLEECFAVLEKLASFTSEDGSISIYTSGNNFNELMKAIKLRGSNIHHELHIDDNDIRNTLDVNNIICALNFSRISCDCYFSDRYLVNFNPGDYIRLYGIPECKFNRERIDNMRSVIEGVWGELVPSFYYAFSLTSFEKIEMILEYLDDKITTVSDSNDSLFSVYKNGKGTLFEKTELAALLLDNYFAKVNCRVVEGGISSIIQECKWLVTRCGNKDYGHSLFCDQRFTDLEKMGYVNGVVSLEDDHKYRDDYSYNIENYSELDEIAYFNLKNILDQKRKFIFPPTILSNEHIEMVDVYSDVSVKGREVFPVRKLSVKYAPRKVINKVKVKKKDFNKINKVNRHNTKNK